MLPKMSILRKGGLKKMNWQSSTIQNELQRTYELQCH